MPTVLDGVSSNETVSLKWVETIANPATPMYGELVAASAVNLECLLTETFSPDASVEKTQLRRMCSREVRERNGLVTRTIADLVGVYDPQDLAADVSKAYVALEPGDTGFLVVRWGVHVDEPWDISDLVDVYPVEVGYRTKIAAADNDELQFKAGISITGQVHEDVPIIVGGSPSSPSSP